MLTLSRKELNIVALAALVFASLTFQLVDKVVSLVPVLNGLVDVADSNGLPSLLGYLLHVVVFALALKFVLPRM